MENHAQHKVHRAHTYYNAITYTIITPSIVANTYLLVKLQILSVKPLLHLRSLASAIYSVRQESAIFTGKLRNAFEPITT